MLVNKTKNRLKIIFEFEKFGSTEFYAKILAKKSHTILMLF